MKRTKIIAPNLTHYFKGNDVEIDVSLYETIMAFNDLGYETYSCCSGLPEDHIGEDDRNCGFYIAFSTVLPSDYVKVASDMGFVCDLWRDYTWIGKKDRPIKDDDVRTLISKWNKMLRDELCLKKKVDVFSARERFLQGVII